MQAEATPASNVPPVPRPAHPPLTRKATVAIVALAGIVVGLLAEHAAESWLQPAWIPIADLGVGWLMIGCGLLAAAARPAQPAGGRLVLAGFAWFVGTFGGAEDPVVQALGFSFGGYHDLVLVWLVLSFPGRWPVDRAAVVSLGAVAVLYGAQSIARLILRAPDAFGVSILDPDMAMQIVLRVDVVRAASVVVAGVLILRRLIGTHGPDRYHTGPLLAAGAASAIVSGTNARYALVTLGLLPNPGDDVTIPLQWVFNIVRIVVPLAILLSVLRLRAARASLAGAVTEMGDSPTAAALRDALATALGDPGLQILTWDPRRGAYLERSGHVATSAELATLEQDPALAVLHVDSDGGQLAILAISRNLMDDPALVEAGVALTRLVVRNERQSLRIEEQLAEVRASRARIVEAVDAERRRIERDLHDGPSSGWCPSPSAWAAMVTCPDLPWCPVAIARASCARSLTTPMSWCGGSTRPCCEAGSGRRSGRPPPPAGALRGRSGWPPAGRGRRRDGRYVVSRGADQRAKHARDARSMVRQDRRGLRVALRMTDRVGPIRAAWAGGLAKRVARSTAVHVSGRRRWHEDHGRGPGVVNDVLRSPSPTTTSSSGRASSGSSRARAGP